MLLSLLQFKRKVHPTLFHSVSITIVSIVMLSQSDISCYKVIRRSRGTNSCTKWTNFPFFSVFPESAFCIRGTCLKLVHACVRVRASIQTLFSHLRSCVMIYLHTLFFICLMWLICYILTITGVLPSEPDKWGYEARTYTRIEVLNKARWFRFPNPRISVADKSLSSSHLY